jgi:hypothetical protein
MRLGISIFVGLIFAVAVWFLLFRFFFDDAYDLWEGAKEHTRWSALFFLFEKLTGFPTGSLDTRFSWFIGIGLIIGTIAGLLFYRNL